MSISILCRLCGLKCEKYVDIYDSNDSSKGLDTKIASCLQILISKDDVLPKAVCGMCCVKLDESFDFFEKSNKAQLTLKEIYHPKTETCKRKEFRISNQYRDNLQNEEAKIRQNGNSELEAEAQSQEDSVLIPNVKSNQLDIHSINCQVTVNQNINICPFSETDDGEGQADIITTVQKKSNRRKKDPNINDLPTKPRLTQLLQGYPWPCTICEDRAMDSLQDLKGHYKVVHQQPPIYKCITCEKQYEHYRSFSKHIKLHRNPQKFTCDVCGKSFAQKTILQSHATVHTSDRPHICHTCGKSFKNFSSLRIHGKIHLPDQAKHKYHCEFCEKGFRTRNTLESHKKIHTGERNFVCDICGKSFIAKGSLNYHLLSHTGVKDHACSMCGKAFKTARLLGKHMTLHTGIKPHQCDVCGKQFRERGALREHSRIHTGAMPYSCDFCGKVFRFKGILTVHRRQHTGERPYACLECRRYFTNWANYNKHMKRIHHCDTSNPENRRQRSATNNGHLETATTELSKSVIVAEEKTDQHSITHQDIPMINSASELTK